MSPQPKSTVVFAAVVRNDPAGGYQASFPDVPGASAHAGDSADLVRAAREALLERLAALTESGEAWPQPSSLDRVREIAGAEGAILIIEASAEDAPIRINISLGERLLKRIDAAAAARGMTRSGFIAAAARAQLGEAAFKSGPRAQVDFEAAARRLQEELTAFGRRMSDSFGPESAFSRNLADWDKRVYDTIQRAADNVSAAMARRKDRSGAPPDRGGAPTA
ncbi:MAG TPA: type II toxin-antitoxin system HicB family antitoxin [Caulobacteraceae bacterium]|nr:type II toxin-antitoxin system HicB family antitoxin [Caulobacteraceae bacterium]